MQLPPSNTDLWVKWADGFMVPVDEIEEFPHRSDDYICVSVLNYDEMGEPSKYTPVTRDPAVVGSGLQNQLAQLDSEAGFQ